MTLYQASSLCAAILHFALALFVLSRDFRARVNRVYFLWGICLTAWNLGTFIVHQLPHGQDATALFWARVIHLGVLMAPVTMLHLCFLVAQVSWTRVLRGFYAATLLLALTIPFTHWYIASMQYVTYRNLGYFVLGGPAWRVFTYLYTAIAATALATLYVKQRSLPSLHRIRLRALMAANIILLVVGTNDMMPLLGRFHYPFTQIVYYPTGGMAAIVFGIVMAYGVLQHHLLDIHLSISRTASFLVQMLFGLVSGLLLFLTLRLMSPEVFTGGVILGAMSVLLINTILIARVFPSFLGRGSDELERRILGDRFKYHEDLRRYTERTLGHPNPEAMTTELHDLFASTVGMKSFQLIMLDETTQVFTLVHSHPDRVQGTVAGLTPESPLLRYFRGAHPGYLAFKIAYAMPGQTELEQAARQDLPEFDAEFAFPLYYEKRVFGLLLIGPKANEDPYTPQDLHLLVALAHNLSLLLNQVRLKNQVLAAQEQEMLGRMSRGLAHDLNNLLTPVQTFFQLCAQGLMDKEGMDDLLPVAMRNVETVRSYVNEALFFSRTHRLETRPSQIDETIRAAVDLIEPRAREKDIQFRLEGLAPTSVEMDEVMIRRLLTNLLSNAVDASPSRSTVQVQLGRLPRAQSDHDWVRVKIMDSGEGISRENLERVFTPYFTTKDRGDGRRGFGLGLAIAKKIVHLHGGNLSIASIEKKGTTVQVDLPSRPPAPESKAPPAALTAVGSS